MDTITSYWKTEAPFAGGHDLTSAKISVPVPTEPVSEFTFRHFRHLDVADSQEFLQKCNGSIFNSRPPLEQTVSTLYVPIKHVNTKKRKHPWFTQEHRNNMLNERDYFYKLFDRTRHRADLQNFRRVGDATHEGIENARLDYYANRLSNI